MSILSNVKTTFRSKMLRRLYDLFISDREIEVYSCHSCGKLRTDLEWKVKKERACRCGSVRVISTYPNLMGRFRIKARYLAKGY